MTIYDTRAYALVKQVVLATCRLQGAQFIGDGSVMLAIVTAVSDKEIRAHEWSTTHCLRLGLARRARQVRRHARGQ